ncbi:MAG TPA: hypothetical protein VIV11_30880 [Kofleriaceae bacterium]
MVLARAGWVLAVCGACSFDHGWPGGGTGSDGSLPRDASMPMIDVPDGFVFMDAPIDARMCFGNFVNICLTTLPTGDMTVAGNTDINTDTGCPFVFMQNTGSTLCGVVAKNITITGRLRANGPRPLVVIATETLTIAAGGMIDVGSYKVGNAEVVGAGAATGSTLCGSPSTGQGDNDMNGAGGGGGAGGSFAGKGGNGADGRLGGGGNGGNSANATGTPNYMRGGCRGTAGGSGNGNIAGGGAAGGGAVLVIAGTSITNNGHIRAGGMGGHEGSTESGGGGGGSGGMIVLDAMTIMNAGILNANGGGGGEGGGQSAGEGGSSALDGTSAASGGAINVNGGNGGQGSWTTTLGGAGGGTGTLGGGAGGGGAGAIRFYPAQAVGGTVSPNPT